MEICDKNIGEIEFMKKIYYKVRFQLTSPLSLGSGENINTDKDLLRDSAGRPFIPGSSLAGIYRHIYEKSHTKDQTDKIFGKVDIATEYNQQVDAVKSTINVYDAVLCDNACCRIVKRDGVKLDEYKTAETGANYNYEILEPGAEFVTFLEQNLAENKAGEAKKNSNDNAARWVLSYWKQYGLQIGAKTRRGLGETKIVKIQQAVFDINSEENNIFTTKSSNEKPADDNAWGTVTDWLAFDMYGNKNWKDFTPFKEIYSGAEKEMLQIRLSLRQKGGLSIRQYTTDISEAAGNMPDYRQLRYTICNDNADFKKEYAVIPGTTWAGAFRHQMQKLGATEKELRDLFGTHRVKQDKEMQNQTGQNTAENQATDTEIPHRSEIVFSESTIEIGEGKAHYKKITRNAIDRFTGGTVEGALYTEEYVCGGVTELRISVPQKALNVRMANLLAAAITDLHYGFMAIGGLTAVGRGLFVLTAINGITIGEKQKGIENPVVVQKNGVWIGISQIGQKKAVDENQNEGSKKEAVKTTKGKAGKKLNATDKRKQKKEKNQKKGQEHNQNKPSNEQIREINGGDNQNNTSNEQIRQINGEENIHSFLLDIMSVQEKKGDE